jgi:putative ABC transport system ATP-binding protein
MMGGNELGDRRDLPPPIGQFLRKFGTIESCPFRFDPMLEPIIAIDQVNHYFGKGNLRKQILFEVTGTVEPGEVVIMTGPSGSGKTTLLTLIGALRSTQEGSIKLLGQELRNAPSKQLVELRRNIGYIFQAHNLLESLTARQNVMMSLELHDHLSAREQQEMADGMLAAVGLGDRATYYPEELSGGQKQRVAIARALVSSPKLILADEPTAALDKKSGRDVVEIMRRLAKEKGSAVMLVTHDNRILDVADRLIHMEDGRLASYDIDATTMPQTALAG